MLAKDRHQHILERLSNKQTVSVDELLKDLTCSVATLRRDLRLLESQGRLTRIHGGATLALHDDEWLLDKFDKESTNKQAVARFAVKKFVKKHMNVFLDAGSATHFLIPYLANQSVTVITNGVHHVPRLLDYGIDTLLIGGFLKSKTQAIVGATAIDQINHYHFDLAFLGVNSIHHQFGLATPDEKEALLKRAVIKQATQTIALADYTKFQQASFHHFAKIDDVIIVSQSVPKGYSQKNILTIKEV